MSERQGIVVPFVDLAADHREIEGELKQAFSDALGSSTFVGGPEVEAFEREWAAYCGTRHCVGVGSGTDALRFALMAAGVGAGDAVVTVAFTFVATAEAIMQAGAEVELVDIDERYYTMCPVSLAEYLDGCETDPKTGRPLGQRTGKPIKAIVPVHLYGQMADMDPILDQADRYGLVVVEDACQAHGAEYLTRRDPAWPDGDWRRAGSLGIAAAFSFYPGKNLGALGEAGAVTTSDGEVAERVKLLRDHGQRSKYDHVIQGYNGRLDALQAAFLRIKLRRLDAWNERRRAAAARYRRLLRDRNKQGAALVLPLESPRSRHVYHLYVVRCSERDSTVRTLRTAGIQTGIHYPIPLHLQTGHWDWGYSAGTAPRAEAAASSVLSLPVYPAIAEREQAAVWEALSPAAIPS